MIVLERRTPHLSDERMDDLVDGLLAPADRSAAETHLAACAACEARRAELRALLVLARAERRPEPAPAELWPLVAASTVHFAASRRRVARALRAPLLAAALALVAVTSATTAWVTMRVVAPGQPPVRVLLAEDAALDRALALRAHANGPIPEAELRALRRRLAEADAALRAAPDDEALYRALASRERVRKDARAATGRGPRPPRAPMS